MECPVCKKEFNEKTGRRPKKFCSDECKVKFWNAKKKEAKPSQPVVEIRDFLTTGSSIVNLETNVVIKNETNTVQEITDKLEIERQIAEIYKEKIPKERDTLYGRKSWQAEQNKKIAELKALLNQ